VKNNANPSFTMRGPLLERGGESAVVFREKGIAHADLF
jgi:hypothetical protein